jgi:hypothetical protein
VVRQHPTALGNLTHTRKRVRYGSRNHTGHGQITAVDSLAVELVEADETVVIIRWRLKPSVFHQYHVGRGDRSQADCGDQLAWSVSIAIAVSIPP